MDSGLAEEKQTAHFDLSISLPLYCTVSGLVFFGLPCTSKKILGHIFSFRIKHVENMKNNIL